MKNKKLWSYPYNGRGELACAHGVGHGGIHGCDGCCQTKEFKKAWSREFKKGTPLKK